MIIKDFFYKRLTGRLLIAKKVFGLGIWFDLISATWDRERLITFNIDFIFLRFWLIVYKK